ncbi:glycerol-3-phosphate acyltransferase [Bacteroidota bacterium]
MEYFISGVIGYLLGSIPTAYLVLKKFKNIDITEGGSGNVGTMNSYRTTSSKLIGGMVLVIDLLKGLLSVLITKLIFGEVFIYPAVALIFAVFGHCYSPWIKFKGGRGLATAAGGAILLSIPVLILWLLFFAIGFLFRKNVHFANASSTFLTGAVCVSTGNILSRWSSPPAESAEEFGILIAIMLTIIFIRHIKPLKKYYQNQKNQIGKSRS